MEGPPRYPFEILPKEMWEMIILKVEDSEDLRNLMKASKQLNDSFVKIRHLWLLDKVLPLLTTTYKKRYLELKDIKKLRLVDKRWCGAVNTYLENQPILRPYNKDDDKVNSEEHIWTDVCFEHERVDSSEALENVTFVDFDRMKKVPEYFNNRKRHPFLARSIEGWTQPDNYEDDDDPYEEDNITFWAKMIRDVFKMFGKHIWFLTMVWEGENNFGEWEPKSMWKWLVRSLSSLPNLKALQLQIYEAEFEMLTFQDSKAEEFLQSKENQLPPLPFLESLRISGFRGAKSAFVFFISLVSGCEKKSVNG